MSNVNIFQRMVVAIKENINAIKQELSTEEQFLESMIKGERFFKKYKWPLAIGASVLIIALIGYTVFNSLEQKRIADANKAYQTLLQNPNDKDALKALKDAKTPLYATFLTKKALESNDKEALEAVLASDADRLLKDLASYQLTGKNDGLLSNLSALQEGYLKLEAGDIDGANAAFSKIELTSPLQNIVKNLQHYQGK